MKVMEKMSIENYYETVKENEFYNRAISRTNLNCKILMKRIKDFPRNEWDCEYNFIECFRYIIWNHILQAYHHNDDIDLIPGTAGDMYGYYVEIIQLVKNDFEKIANLSSGTLRFDSTNGQFVTTELLYREQDLFSTVLKSMKYFEEKIILKINDENISRYKTDYELRSKEIYLSIHQVLTMVACMGLTREWIRGGEPLAEFLKLDKNVSIKHLDYFVVLLMNRKYIYINKDSGDVFDKNRLIIKYEDWCNGDVGQGINTIIKLNEEDEKPLIFAASVGGFMGRSFKVNLNFIKNTCVYTKFDSQYSNEKTENRGFSEDKMNVFFKRISKVMLNWDKHYKTEDVIMDGTSWSVHLITNKGRISCTGSNAYPQNWRMFCKMISQTIGYFS